MDPMEYRNLGNSGLQVSALGLGTNNIGRQVDMPTTQAIVDKCLEYGMTFFDTADVYGAERGRSEEFLGRALKPHRRDVVIATKGSGAMGEGPYWSGASRRYLMDALEASLRRLDTDRSTTWCVPARCATWAAATTQALRSQTRPPPRSAST
jgi:aryl-alcohol dehydrogenase-like predicted oxidoreductase